MKANRQESAASRRSFQRTRYRVLVAAAMTTFIAACCLLLTPRIVETVVTTFYISRLQTASWGTAAEALARRGCVKAIRHLLPRTGPTFRLQFNRSGTTLSPLEYRPEASFDDALESFVYHDPTGAVRELVSLLGSNDVLVRRRAALWLRGSGYLAARWLPQLRRAIADSDPCVRVQLAWVLYEVGDPVAVSSIESVCVAGLSEAECRYDAEILLAACRVQTPTTIKALCGLVCQDPESAFVAEGVLGAAGTHGVEAARELLRAGDTRVRKSAVSILLGNVTSTPVASEELIATLSDDDVEVRLAALDAIAEIESLIELPGEVVNRLAMGTKGERVRLLRLLGHLKSGRTLFGDHILREVKDQDYEIRAAAMKALPILGEQVAVANLLDATRDGSLAVRRAAAELLCKVYPHNHVAAERLLELSQDADCATRVWAFTRLLRDRNVAGRFGPASSLSEMLSNCSDAVCEAMLFLGPDGRAVAPALVLRLLHGNPWSGREILALKAIGPERADLMPLVKALSEVPDLGPDNGGDAILLLGPAAAPIQEDLASLLDHARPTIQAKAAQCIAAMGVTPGDWVIGALRDLHFNARDRLVRYRAWEALSTFLGREFLRTDPQTSVRVLR